MTVSDDPLQSLAARARLAGRQWDFPGWGEATRIEDLSAPDAPLESRPAHMLGPWLATAICGNDITSSVLYVSALSIIAAGIYAPLCLAMVAMVLYLFRSIYAEVGSALPLNGGAYNVLLNTTSKSKASLAACLTLLSYVATAVISANEALHYLHHIVPATPIVLGTVCLLGVFAMLNIIGIAESAVTALVIFLLHLSTIALLAICVSVHLANSGLGPLLQQWVLRPRDHLGRLLFDGFAAGMLGISGFESSANFIEEQKPGVFPKTLRNMWLAVALINPLITFLALASLPRSEIEAHRTALLSELGARSAGNWLATWVSVDAVLVLSGAVLTSYVGVTGLAKRMTLDRCLPQVLLRETRRRTPHWIILGFFGLCTSVLFITRGDVETLAGVYTISFLGVMTLFVVGNRLLALRRSRLPRTVHASWFSAIFAASAVLAALYGNLMRSGDQARVFSMYFAVTASMVAVMFLRVKLLYALLYVVQHVAERVQSWNDRIEQQTRANLDAIRSQAVVFFTRGDSLVNLRRAVEYVLGNEHTNNLIVVTCYTDETHVPPELAHDLKTLDQVFPELRIDFVLVKATFGPALVEQLSRRLRVPKNYMFIGCPGDRFPHNLPDLGGVRLIV
jgi:amino acid transporter